MEAAAVHNEGADARDIADKALAPQGKVLGVLASMLVVPGTRERACSNARANA